MKHYDDATLLELHYLPDSNGEVAAHIAECGSCSVRLQALSSAMRMAASSSAASDRGDDFWRSQRLAIMDRVQVPEPKWWTLPSFRFVAAALLVVVTGTSWFAASRRNDLPPQTSTVVATSTNATPALTEIDVPKLETSADPWASEELSDFHSMVNWESWERPAESGGTL